LRFQTRKQQVSVKSSSEVPSREGVVHVFDRIAPTYDLLNRLLSFRRDVAWRNTLISHLPTDTPIELLDLATGTADVLIAAKKRVPNLSHGLGLDVSEQMLAQGRKKLKSLGLTDTLELRQGDATALELPDAAFDIVTIAFGIRNVMNTEAALAEMLRVLKPGGQALILEFSLPENALVRSIYLLFFRHILPRLGGLISGDRQAYQYLNRTVETYPYGSAFTDILEAVGFSDCRCQPLTFGIASLYSGIKPR
jgi:demethylmenaquinone methyltransferase / 2-methoxy-6-polyprenyl-1,4-benzoquinol methylase